MQSKIKIEIPGDPIPWARPAQSGKKRFDKQKQLKKSVALIAGAQMRKNKAKIFKGPLKVEFQFMMPIPIRNKKVINWVLKSGGKSLHMIKPDLSNLIKFYEDALNEVVWEDDARIAELHAKKFYSALSGTVIRVEEL